MIVPKTTIHIASVNFALSLPASALPVSHRTGAITIIPTTICINNANRSMAILSFLYLIVFAIKSLVSPESENQSFGKN
jgi:hypothetical protein